MDVRIVVYNPHEHVVDSAIITDDNGWEWLYVSTGLQGECNRTLDIVYEDATEREEGSGYYAKSIDHAIYLLNFMGYGG